MPLRDFVCVDCGKETKDALVRSDEDLRCTACSSTNVQLSLSFPSNYTIGGNNSASVRPKRMGGSK